MNPVASAARPDTGCTAHQRQYIRILFDRLELATDRFTYQHRGPFKDARLAEPKFDGDIDQHLRNLSRTQASSLIRVLERRSGTDEEGED